MEWHLSTHGEDLEQAASTFVHASIPTYEIIWAKFIGHDGLGNMIDVGDLPSQAIKVRKQFAEHHYTVLESAYFMFRLLYDEGLNPIKDFEDYRRMNNSLIAFYGYGGRLVDNLYDCFKKMGYKKAKGKAHPANLSILSESRNTYLHGKKLPLKFHKSGFYMIPQIEKGGWDGFRSTWNDAIGGGMKHETVPGSMIRIFNETIAGLESALGKLSILVDTFIAKYKFSMPPPLIEKYQYLDRLPIASGNLNVSGFTGVDVYGFGRITISGSGNRNPLSPGTEAFLATNVLPDSPTTKK